ncbi:hypothetical protein FHS76_000518 [Ochrobactrum daejeonense]|uniref:Uncharacterized protein n=1 Tax=Brucella daejeonensis TaxID=659015 RepID=A0A7W9AU77_9HYPH|nr:hypothetical protein [Brucella daejeonensis]
MTKPPPKRVFLFGHASISCVIRVFYAEIILDACQYSISVCGWFYYIFSKNMLIRNYFDVPRLALFTMLDDIFDLLCNGSLSIWERSG